MSKQFFTYEQQLNKLKKEKQLTISNSAYAKEILEKLGYYSLIGGYKIFLNIPQKNGQYTGGKNDLFAVMLALRYLIDNEDFKKFKHTLLHVIDNVLKKCPHLSKEQLLNAMGFPENWDNILRYKKF
ncbi:hypothetical protein [Coprococcus sp. AF21-14LB]|uniref:hypothetical protein n=1 Tax=Coprococcus sp. AF21-14LB TaxID=2292231 RepID=UPI000E4D2CA0|nr:hypothetical protein [Coprococcus sp. AF21-14LB]RGS80028.1 hypothetical protein DWX73_06295 [Coprococcus sp. AF21-14LB]